MYHRDPASQASRLLPPFLRRLPEQFRFRYTAEANRSLLQFLFESLAGYDADYLKLLLPNGVPPDDRAWNLSEAQGRHLGAEYSQSARGKPCGHIFHEGEATFVCKTCQLDSTCVLCGRCFEASDHEGHQVHVSLSSGASGCCDCGDPEAWKQPIRCTIHAPEEEIQDEATGSEEGIHVRAGKRKGKQPALPQDVQDNIQSTIGIILDYLCDVFSCAPEHMRTPRHEESVLRDYELAQLTDSRYGKPQGRENYLEYALVLWNDEKHTVDEVEEQVARACRQPKSYGRQKAAEVDQVGRSVVDYSRDLNELLRKARILEQIKVTVTIRSTRDIFREEMCATMIHWMNDICGCSVGDDSDILMDTICREMLSPWRIGSNASNLSLAKQGLPDHQKTDDRLDHQRAMRRAIQLERTVIAARQATQGGRVDIQVVVGDPARLVGIANQQDESDDDQNDDDDDDDMDNNELDEEPAEEAPNADEMDLDDSVTQEQDVTVDTGRLSDRVDVMSIQAASSPRPASDEDDASALSPQHDTEELLNKAAFYTPRPASVYKAPAYWLAGDSNPASNDNAEDLAIEEDLNKYLRIDFLILYDLRMWKTLRNNLRKLHIHTVIKIPRFKRLLSLRFAAVYRVLAQLYLVADREPEHSIITLSLQMLTVPTIAEELIQRWNFFPKLLAILYTFLTQRQVGSPHDVDSSFDVTLENSAMANRRIRHFFMDINYLLESTFMQKKVREDEQYLLQLLDFVKLHQGIYPTIRATGEHVEYESDAWMATGHSIQGVCDVSRQFCEAFQWNRSQDPTSICRAIRQTAKTTIISSIGADHRRFPIAKANTMVQFKTVEPFMYEAHTANHEPSSHTIVDFTVENSPMSFHHLLHHTLSWLIERGKSMSREQLRGLLDFSHSQIQLKDATSTDNRQIPALEPEQYLLALFDLPLRVCAWMAQIKAGLWVRNGNTLRHQMLVYRGVLSRDDTLQRDIFLLQTSLVSCPPENIIASMIDRYGMETWMRGGLERRQGWETAQMVDVLEELIHMLIVLVSDRVLLRPVEEDATSDQTYARREIIHALCFKPVSHSELMDRLTSKVSIMNDADHILTEVANFRPPDGLHGSGSFELKDECYDEIDPYYAFFSKNQREDAEVAWRTQKSRTTGRKADQIIFEPNLKPIKSGVFQSLSAFTQTPIFAQVIWASLRLSHNPSSHEDDGPARTESLFHSILHLILIAIAEDKVRLSASRTNPSFCDAAIHTRLHLPGEDAPSSIVECLDMILKSEGQHDKTRPKLLLVLQRLREKRMSAFDQAVKDFGMKIEETEVDIRSDSAALETALKKQKAQERQAKLMASFKKQQSAFMANQPTALVPDDWRDLENDVEMENDSTEKVWTFPRDTCIFCQEDTDDASLYGTLAYVNQSRIFRFTNIADEENLLDVQKSGNRRDHSQNDKQQLGKGWPPTQNKSGPVATGCGHLMHWACFETFNAATERRQNFQIARNHPERLSLEEFVCPMCKALGNMFLPIVWKSKSVSPPREASRDAFDDWLTARAPFPESKAHEITIYRQEISRYLSEAFLSEYASTGFGRALTGNMPIVPPTNTSRPWPLPTFLVGRSTPTNSQPSHTADPWDGSRRDRHRQMMESYRRVRNTLEANNLAQQRATMSAEVTCAKALASTLSSSISMVDIAQRGVERAISSVTLLDSVSQQTLTHLRVLSETCSSYTAISIAQNPVTLSESIAIGKSQVDALFGNVLRLSSNDLTSTATLSPDIQKPLFEHDLFDFYTAASIFMGPCLQFDVQNTLQLCVTAEIVKTTMAFIEHYAFISKWLAANKSHGHTDAQDPISPNSDSVHEFAMFTQHIIGCVKAYKENAGLAEESASIEQDPNARYAFDRYLHRTIHSYVLPLLRKSLILQHVRCTIDFAAAKVEHAENEIDQLSRLLGVPNVDTIVRRFIEDGPSARRLQQLAQHWIKSWINHCAQQGASVRSSDDHCAEPQLQLHDVPNLPGAWTGSTGPQWNSEEQAAAMEPKTRPQSQRNSSGHILSLSHPGIYELVQLPRAHDELSTVALRRRCITTGAAMADPCLCLLCGDIVCGQGACCARARLSGTGEYIGGCYQHQAVCGGTVGMYLNINSCAILLMNGRHGSWFSAPYLDRHGEVNLGMRRGRGRLYLNEFRYEKGFRSMWLEHGIASAIARKLEGDVNTGGWETL